MKNIPKSVFELLKQVNDIKLYITQTNRIINTLNRTRMESIIGLYGKERCGKTTTLRMLCEELVKLGANVKTPIPPEGDFRALLSYNGKTLAICTGGDNDEVIKENCEFFSSTNCDIAISASRTSGGTTDNLTKYAEKRGLMVDWIRKNIAIKMYDEVNLAQVKDILAIMGMS